MSSDVGPSSLLVLCGYLTYDSFCHLKPVWQFSSDFSCQYGITVLKTSARLMF